LNSVIEQYGRWSELKIYTERIEGLAQTDFSQSLENAKSLLESICKEICKSKNIEVEATISINQVLKKAFIAIGYPSNSPVIQISSALATIGQQIGILRNEVGITSHGSTLDRLKERNNKIDEMTKEFLIDSTVIVASFLIRNFENENPRTLDVPKEQKILLADNQDFNESLDENYGDFTIGDYSYTASEILFFTDLKAYLTELRAFRGTEE